MTNASVQLETIGNLKLSNLVFTGDGSAFDNVHYISGEISINRSNIAALSNNISLLSNDSIVYLSSEISVNRNNIIELSNALSDNISLLPKDG